MDSYQKYIHASRYARWLPEEGRRETWEETVKRYTDFWVKRDQITEAEASQLGDAIRNLEVMPSMRCLMTAGPALERDNVAGFNCSFMPIDHPRAFDELMDILMNGTGVGFSNEKHNVNKLPDLPEEFHQSETVIKVPDSKIGWSKSFRQLIALLYAGEIPKWDTSGVRKAGEPLRTFGGRASGPEPLEDLFRFTVNTFQKAEGSKLSTLEVHDIVCKVAEIVVVGGVRRSALIGLSNPSDGRMRDAKSGQWWIDDPQRSLANNSAVYTDKPDFKFFLNEMRSLYESKSGERGIFSRAAAKKIVGRNGRRDSDYDFGTNPCSEIILRPNQFCNLSEVVVRPEDTFADLEEKVRKATILGTLQATLTSFRYLRSCWKKNTEEEALLGVSLTGIMDHPLMSGKANPELLKDWLKDLKQVAIDTNQEWAERLGINQAAAITCVKPSGTVSQLVNSASGIHPRFANYYIRRVQADAKDPLAMYMQDAGFYCEDSTYAPGSKVFSFPISTGGSGVTVDEVGAMEQLKLWEIYQDHWCEHKPSITVYYTDDEFLDVAGWVWKNFDKVSGISFLPKSEHSYMQAPYEEITQEQYEDMAASLPEFDWEAAATFESDIDSTTSSQELACVGTSCEL